MALNTVLEKIKELQVFASEDVDTGPRETMPARRGRKARALDELKQLRKQYATDLRRTAAFIVVIGDKRNEFTSMATEGYKCFKADPETFYKDLVDRIPSQLYLGRESISNVFDILGRHLEDKMLQLDSVSGYPQLIFRQQYQRAVKSRKEFLALVKESVVEQIGGEIVGIQAISSLTSEAIKRDHTAKFTPILLPSGDEKFALQVATDLDRISTRVFVVLAGDRSAGPDAPNPTEECIVIKEITDENVKKALKKISNQLKK